MTSPKIPVNPSDLWYTMIQSEHSLGLDLPVFIILGQIVTCSTDLY